MYIYHKLLYGNEIVRGGRLIEERGCGVLGILCEGRLINDY